MNIIHRYVATAKAVRTQRLKPLLMVQSPPTRTSLLVRVGGLRNISHDFNRRRSNR